MGNCRSSPCLPFWPFLPRDAPPPTAQQEQQQQQNGEEEEEEEEHGGGSGRKQGWRKFDFQLRGRSFSVQLPKWCRQAESGDHKLAVFEGSGEEARHFTRAVVDLLQFEHPDLSFFPVLDSSRLVVGVAAGSRSDNAAAYFIPQLDTAQMRFGLDQQWVHSSSGQLYVYHTSQGFGHGRGDRQFCPDLAVTDYEETLAASREMVLTPGDELAYYDLPMMLALEVMAEGDDRADVDRKCRDMVETGAASTAVAFFVWNAQGPPRELDGTVKVYYCDSGEVAVEEHRRPRFLQLDRVHPGLRLYLSALPEYTWPSEERPQIKTGHWQTLLSTCCDASDPEMVKEAINYVGSLNLQDSTGRLGIVEAAKAGDVDLVEYMVKHGAQIDREDGEGIYAYLGARAHQQADVCAWLEERGCKLNPQTSLDQAIRSGRTRLVEYLLRAGGSPCYAAEEQGSWSPASLSRFLSTAMRVSNGEAVRMLLDKGCKPTDNVLNLKLLLNVKAGNETSDWSPTSLSSCLSTAVKVFNEEAVRLLLDRGCKPSLQDHYTAALSTDPSIFNLLLEHHSLSEEDLSNLLRQKENLVVENPQQAVAATTSESSSSDPVTADS